MQRKMISADKSVRDSMMWYAALLLAALCSNPAAAIYQTCSGKTMLRSGGLTCQDKQAIVDGHNKLRQSVALGQVRGQPAASDMLEMAWDDELAAMAQRWADQCTMAHDSHRTVARFPVGQNLASTWTTRTSVSPAPDFTHQIDSWFHEVASFAFRSTGFTHATGHYSQLVWASTYLVGCGYSHYYDASQGYTKLYVCNYGPGGNVIGSLPYSAGNPSCSSRGLRPSSRFSGLCQVQGVSSLGASCRQNSGFGGYTAPPKPAYSVPTQHVAAYNSYVRQPIASRPVFGSHPAFVSRPAFGSNSAFGSHSALRGHSTYGGFFYPAARPHSYYGKK